MQPLIRCDLLILDEFGYLPVDPQIGPALYELVAARYERRATVITSNKSLRQWGELVGGDSALMMAILDRLLHRGEVFYLRGASYRMRGKEALLMGKTRLTSWRTAVLGNISRRENVTMAKNIPTVSPGLLLDDQSSGPRRALKKSV